MTTWPGGAKGAVAFTFDFDAEEVWIGDDPANADRPGVLSQGTYGAKVAVPLILELLERHGLRARRSSSPAGSPSATPSACARSSPPGTRSATTATPTPRRPTSRREAEEAELVRALEILRDLGADPVGYRSPSWEFSPVDDRRCCSKHGFAYSSNYMDDLRPYLHPGTDLVELPIQWILDDAPHFWFSGGDGLDAHDPAASRRATRSGAAELDGHRRARRLLHRHDAPAGDRPAAPAGVPRRFIAEVQARGDVWIASCAEIAGAALMR